MITYNSLYTGIGGLDKGFTQAGFMGQWSGEINDKCLDTFSLNHEHELTITDCTAVDNDLPYADILLSGFPCQPFSIAGQQKGFDDERGNHFHNTIRIAKQSNPKVILLENVKNFKGHDKGKTYKTVQSVLESHGYYFKDTILNSMTHGNIPQNRERFFLVASKNLGFITCFEFPEPIPLTVSFRDFLEDDIPEKYFYEQYDMHDILKLEMTNPDTVYQWRRKYVRENKKGVVPTLTKNMGTGGHNVPLILDKGRIRKLTPKECFNLQGFCDIQLPSLADSHLYQQAGNSVTVPLVERIAKNIKKALNG